MKSIIIYDENKYADEQHSKTALDALVIPSSVMYNWIRTPFSEYSKAVIIKYQTVPGTVTSSNGRVSLKGDFMQFNIYPLTINVWKVNSKLIK